MYGFSLLFSIHTIVYFGGISQASRQHLLTHWGQDKMVAISYTTF